MHRLKRPASQGSFLRCGFHYVKRADPMTPRRQKAMVKSRKDDTNGNFWWVNPEYSSKTEVAGRQFRRMQGRMVINQTS